MRKLMTMMAILIATIILTSCKPDDPEIETLVAIINPSLDTIEWRTAWSDPGCTTNGDSCQVTENNVDTSEIGEYDVFYVATRGEEELVLKRVVTVVDIFDPIINLLPGLDSVKVDDTWVDGGCTAFDDYDDDVACTRTSSPIDTSTAGTYVVQYEAVDSSGNTATMERYVTVSE